MRRLYLLTGAIITLLTLTLLSPRAYAAPPTTTTTSSITGTTNGVAGAGTSWVYASEYPNAIAECLKNNGNGAAGNLSCFVTAFNHNDMKSLTTDIVAIPGIAYNINETNIAYIRRMQDQSALGGVTRIMASMYGTPPANLAYWAADAGQTLGFIPHSAMAQGIGFTGLNPLLGVWKGFRNMAYALLAVVMIVIGFMVMFRKKIDPKTVVTVQNSLPRIIVVLILITFSYAIVGLLIDLMYVVIAAGIKILDASLPGGATVTIFGQQADFLNGGVLTLLGSIFAPLLNTSSLAQNFGTMTWVQNFFGGLLTAVLTGGTTLVLGTLITLIVSVAYLFGFVRIFFMLLSAYINIILAVIIGPIQILFDALPGGTGFSSWFKNLFLNLIPFPITIFMLILGFSLSSTLGTNQLWQPPLLPQAINIGPVQTGNIASGLATTLLWLGIVLTIPTIVNSIKEAMKTKAAVPAGFGAVLGPIGAGAGQIIQLGYQGGIIKGAFFGHDQKKYGPGTDTMGRATTGQSTGIST
ncbi:hypothetical protein M1555_04210 [Patescibacteria group bacterium]|nr:hypothetical protein [Patescibacteria group bacterium]